MPLARIVAAPNSAGLLSRGPIQSAVRNFPAELIQQYAEPAEAVLEADVEGKIARNCQRLVIQFLGSTGSIISAFRAAYSTPN